MAGFPGYGAYNIPGTWHMCVLNDVYHEDSGSDSDFRKAVVSRPPGTPDPQGKLQWQIISWCWNDSAGAGAMCFNYF